jgi:hypothetical protein
MTEVNSEPTPEPDSELDSEVLDELADDDEQVTDMRGVRRLRSEAKRLRMLLREEQENRASEQASALARIAEYERREVERAAAALLIDPQDVLRYTDEKTQAEFNDEFGAVIGDRVKAAAQAIIEARPHLARSQRPPTDQPLESLRSGAMPEVRPKPTSWAAAIRGTGA